MTLSALESFKKTCTKHLIIDNTDYIDIIFGAIFANRLDSKPVWLYIVGPPGAGKTEIVQSLEGHPKVISRSTLTRNALISGFKLKEGQDSSLIPMLDGKTLLVKDFTTMLNMRREDLHEILGILRDAYDGRCCKSFGTGETKYYQSKFGVIAAVTDAIDRHRSLLSDLGERFITYRMPSITEHEKARRSLCAMSSESTDLQETELRIAAEKVLNQEVPPATMTKAQMKSIIRIAQIAARARTTVNRDRFTKEPDIPRPEVATRLSKQLGDLATGMAMAHGLRKVTSKQVIMAQHVALHCITLKRYELFRFMLQHDPEFLTINDISEAMGFSYKSVQYWMEDLLLLRLVERRKICHGQYDEYRWRLFDGPLLKKVFLCQF